MSKNETRLLPAVLLVWFVLAPTAGADFGDYVSHAHDGRALVVRTSVGELRLTAVDDGAMEAHYLEDGVRQLPSFALDPAATARATTLTHADDRLVLDAGGLTAVVHKSPVTLSWRRGERTLIEEEFGYFARETLRGFRFRLNETEKMLGGGQRVLGMDRRGLRLPLYNRASYGYTRPANQMYYGLPAVLSSERYVVVFDNSASGFLDIGASQKDVLQFEAVGGRTAYVVAAGDTWPQLMHNYVDATGRQPLPPRWALGNFASRFGYRSEKEARDTVLAFRRQRVPLDAIVLDLYWFGPDVQGHMGNLDWDRDAWPDPEGMMADFARAGVRTIPITEPFILTTSNNWQAAVDADALARNLAGEPRRFDFFFGNTGLVDVFDDGARAWFEGFYARLFAQGVAGTWGDLGEPEVHPGDSIHRWSPTGLEATGDEVHNAYGHEWARLAYEAQRRAQPDTRAFVMMRSGFAGSQRYGLMPWTGDVSRSWGGLEPQVELSLQMGLLGLAYNHSDLGGFAGGEAFDAELYTRWLQFGVFQPIYRPHAHESIAPEPVFHDRRTRNVVRDFIRLRYRLLPYLYTLAFENTTTGMPLMRPLFFADDSDPLLIDVNDAYLWGDAFLVAPVASPGATAVDVRLPSGVWFDYWSGQRHEGGSTVRIGVTAETIPVLVRAGAFVPMVPLVETTRDYSSEALTVHYYADAGTENARGRMFEDDGESPDTLATGRYELLNFAARHDAAALEIMLSRDSQGYRGMPASRAMTMVVHNSTQRPSVVTLGGEELRLRERAPGRRWSQGAWYDADAGRLTLRWRWNHAPVALRIAAPDL